MKLSENHRNKVARRHSSRSRPYDLRRKVLVNNFLKDQTPIRPVAIKSQPSKVSESDEDNGNEEELDLDISCTDESTTNGNQDSTITSEEREDSSSETLYISDDSENENASNNSANSEFSPETKEFLRLISRRLKISDSSKPNLNDSTRVTRSTMRVKGTSSSESDSANKNKSSCKESYINQRLSRKLRYKRQSKNRTSKLHPLRSYPTFDKLNEIFDSTNSSKSLSAKIFPRSLHRKARCNRLNKIVKGTAARKRISNKFTKIFRRRDFSSENSRTSSGSDEVEADNQNAMQENLPKSPKKTAYSDKVLDSTSGSQSPNYYQPNEFRVTRSKSLTVTKGITQFVKSRPRSESFKLQGTFFTLTAPYKSAGLL